MMMESGARWLSAQDTFIGQYSNFSIVIELQKLCLIPHLKTTFFPCRFSVAAIPQAEARPHGILAVAIAEIRACIREQSLRCRIGAQDVSAKFEPVRDAGKPTHEL